MTQSQLSDQYAPAQIRKYEAIYGRHFVSPGGEGCARECVTRLNLAPGDRVLASHFGTFSHLWLDMCERLGLKVHALAVAWGRGVPLNRYR